MSGTLPHYLKMALVAATDLFLGSSLAYLVDKIFRDKFTYEDPTDLSGKWKHDFLVASAQAALTILASDQLRGLVYPPEFQDPTGGVCYMMSILRQPSLWEKTNFVVEGGFMMLPRILKKEPLMEERPKEPEPFPRMLSTTIQNTPSAITLAESYYDDH